VESNDTAVQNEPAQAVAQPASPPLSHANAAAATDARRRILVVEDNELNQTVTMWQLRACGFDADLAINGKVAVDRRGKESADRRVTIIAFTANAIEDEIHNCLAAGMDDFLTKPVQLPALKAMLQKWICTQE